MKQLKWVVIFVVAMGLSGCGQNGPLCLPSKKPMKYGRHSRNVPYSKTHR